MALILRYFTEFGSVGTVTKSLNSGLDVVDVIQSSAVE